MSLEILLRVDVPPISIQVIRPIVGDALNRVAIVVEECGEDRVFFVHTPANKRPIVECCIGPSVDSLLVCVGDFGDKFGCFFFRVEGVCHAS